MNVRVVPEDTARVPKFVHGGSEVRICRIPGVAPMKAERVPVVADALSIEIDLVGWVLACVVIPVAAPARSRVD